VGVRVGLREAGAAVDLRREKLLDLRVGERRRRFASAPTPYSAVVPLQYDVAATSCETKVSSCETSGSPWNETATILGAFITGPPSVIAWGMAG
jgi:hypothetical protein